MVLCSCNLKNICNHSTIWITDLILSNVFLLLAQHSMELFKYIQGNMLYSQSTTISMQMNSSARSPRLCPKQRRWQQQETEVSASDIVAPEHTHKYSPHTNTVATLKDPNCSHYNLELIDLQPPQVGFIITMWYKSAIISYWTLICAAKKGFHNFLLVVHCRRVLFWWLKPLMKAFI